MSALFPGSIITTHLKILALVQELHSFVNSVFNFSDVLGMKYVHDLLRPVHTSGIMT